MATATIIVGVDGSTHAADAVRWAATYAPNFDARVVVAYAFEPPVPLAPPATTTVAAPLDDAWLGNIREMLDTEWCAPLREAGVEFETRVIVGDPSTALAELATGTHASLLVVGRRGRNPVTEFVLGSVSHQLSRHAPCPLVIIPTSGAFSA